MKKQRPPWLVTDLWFENTRDAARYEHARQRRIFLFLALPLFAAALIIFFLCL